MKKLMIAAAAAAMICGAEAKTVVYDFNACLTTTTGMKYDAYTSETTFTYNLGANKADYPVAGVSADTILWYDDTSAAGLAAMVNRTTTPYSWAAKVAPATGTFQDDYPHLVWTIGYDVYGNQYSTWTQTSLELNANEIALLTHLAANYNSQGEHWCCSITRSFNIPGGCYRVAAGDSITGVVGLDVDNCCTVGNAAYKNFYIVNVANDGTLTRTAQMAATWDNMHVAAFGSNIGNAEAGLCNLFGGRTLDESICVELLARVDNLNVITDVGRQAFRGYIAGQGSRGLVADNINALVSLSGNIVGSTTPSVCRNCCVAPLVTGAFAFDSCALAQDATLRTAAYGTFYLTFRSYEAGL